ncbi:GNAT family N-acetyltransferase [Rheinheimera texasensis]|uniref:GNAT family N-acetyltransferase n=1 Tax=Rheinheimera texasensis TaxID=306205 RepID=UPI00068EBC38|nr:GNAT family N-acetyltransferase [Rheinheimera texasensis]
MPASPHSELLQAWSQCRTQRWRLPVWAQGDDAFLQGCWQWLQSQLQSTDRIFWLGDPWPTFNEQLQVRQIAGQARQQLLGQECDVLIIQATSGMDWDLVAASMGCLTAGGIWLLLTADAEIFSQQPNPAARRLLSYPTDAAQHVGRFQHWLASQWQQQPLVCWNHCGLDNRLMAPTAASTVAEFTTPYASHCQQLAVAAIHHVVSGHRHRPLVLSAHRGRGKSAALGLAAAQLQQAGKTKLIITAPQPAAAQVALEICQRRLGEDTPSLLQFWPVDRLLAEQPSADLLLIDEAAAIPAPQLQALTESYSRVVFATTEHGYEGTGRGFQLRFQQYLQQHRPGWRKLVLQQPIRYGRQDPLEQLIFRSFLLDDPDTSAVTSSTSALQSHRYSAMSLAEQPALLQQVFRLACLAHYQTSVRDLWALLDDPSLLVFTLQQEDIVVAVAVVSQEGQLPPQLLPDIYQGKRRVQGHLAAQSLIYHCLWPEAGTRQIWRVQRLIVRPDLQRQRLGRGLLNFISSEAGAAGVDLMATSFGATPALAGFWQSAGYVAVKLSTVPDQSSNEYSVLMLKQLNQSEATEIGALQQYFGQNLWQQADIIWSRLDPLLLQLWAKPVAEAWSCYDQQLLQLFMQGQRDWAQSSMTLKRWLNLHFQALPAQDATHWIPLCWQRQDLRLSVAELRTLSLQLRQTACLADLYQIQ